jgi:AraC family transcriptional regulator of adaptative response/methylated-DNA-[protein]-cysteine methyltransferase
VRFYTIPEAAEAAGFRACRRCRPHQRDAADPGLERIRRVCQAIDQQPDRIPRLAELAASVGVSSAHLQRSFKRAVGISPREYAEARRLGRLKRNLRNGRSVSAAQYETGLSSSSRLYERAPRQLGMTPATYQRGGKGTAIQYGFTRSSLGELLVAATSRGICAVMLGDRRRMLERELRSEFPEAQITRDDRRLDGFLSDVVGIVGGQENRSDLPLDIQATAFQWRVWKLLRKIPMGETRTYGELAKVLGVPGAARAVGRACATNPVALVIPCHRVLRGDGGVGGYRWGPDRKKKLLDAERAGAAG